MESRVTRPAQDAARELRGVVVRGVDSRGVSGAWVELHRVTADSGALVDSVVSARDGSFRFLLREPPGSTAVYLTAARHQGVLYFGPPLHGGEDPPRPYRVLVYDTAIVSGAPGDVTVSVRHTILSPLEPGSPALEVMDVFDLEGTSGRTLVAAAPGQAVWTARFPRGATDKVVVPSGPATGEIRFVDGRVILAGPLRPTGRRVTLRYMVPDGALELPVDHRTRRLELLIARTASEPRVEGAEARETTEVEGRVYLRFTGRELDAGSRVAVSWSAAGPNAAAWAWLAAGITLLAAAVFAMRRSGCR
ncbi:MAG: hypothetical protein ACE5JR_02370 [Gemmatimonadota bacterium]